MANFMMRIRQFIAGKMVSQAKSKISAHSIPDESQLPRCHMEPRNPDSPTWLNYLISGCTGNWGYDDSWRPGRVFRDFDRGPEMIVLPKGYFQMGSPWHETNRNINEGPQHKVNIAYPLAVGRYAVTFDEWDACVAAGACKHRPDDNGWGRGRHPVINVNWEDAQAFVCWLRSTTGKRYRLLSEAEWEYAARAGTRSIFSWGDFISSEDANFNAYFKSDYYCSELGKTYRAQTIQVGSFKPNAFGLYDMHGNVSEWVEDAWHDTYDGAPANGEAWLNAYSHYRVTRGGSWDHAWDALRSARRWRALPDTRHNALGFRVAIG